MKFFSGFFEKLKKVKNVKNIFKGKKKDSDSKAMKEQKFYRFYKRFSVNVFGNLVEKYLAHFEQLNTNLNGANIKMMLKTWISIIFMSSVLVYVCSLASVLALSYFLAFDMMTTIYFVIFIPILMASLTFIIFYIYPVQKASSIKGSIDNNLPFALSHMSAIASSGIPPEYMFEFITDFKEYGEISNQCSMVVRNIRTFGMSSLSAIKDVAERTPSQDFKEILSGISATIEKGGDLINYMDEMSKQQLFQYRLKREKYLKTLSTYADIYTAMLVAAPLMMLSVLGVMGIIGGNVLGFSIQELMFLITWVGLPALNIAFLTFVHVTYPGV